MKTMKKNLAVILCMMLIMATAAFTNGCSKTANEGPSIGVESTVVEEVTGSAEEDTAAEELTEENAEANVLGEGETQFAFTVVDKDGNETAFEIHTDKELVGEALAELGLIEGEESEFGLYVNKVNGIIADFDVDGTYWAFYVNGEYAQAGVDATAITAGDSYSFKVKK